MRTSFLVTASEAHHATDRICLLCWIMLTDATWGTGSFQNGLSNLNACLCSRKASDGICLIEPHLLAVSFELFGVSKSSDRKRPISQTRMSSPDALGDTFSQACAIHSISMTVPFPGGTA